VKQVQQGLQNF